MFFSPGIKEILFFDEKKYEPILIVGKVTFFLEKRL